MFVEIDDDFFSYSIEADVPSSLHLNVSSFNSR
jgi:hypothetical protein